MIDYISKDDKIELLTSAKKRIQKSKALGMNTQEDYEEIINEAASIRVSKVGEYGEERYRDEDTEWNLWMLICDVNRKVSRFRQLTKFILATMDTHPEEARKAVVKLRSDYLDIANYGLMGAQIIDKLQLVDKLNGIIEKQNEEQNE